MAVGKLFISNLDPATTEEQIRAFIVPFAEILELDRLTGNDYCIVKVRSGSIDEVIRTLDNRVQDNRKITVQRMPSARHRPPRRDFQGF